MAPRDAAADVGGGRRVPRGAPRGDAADVGHAGKLLHAVARCDLGAADRRRTTSRRLRGEGEEGRQGGRRTRRPPRQGEQAAAGAPKIGWRREPWRRSSPPSFEAGADRKERARRRRGRRRRRRGARRSRPVRAREGHLEEFALAGCDDGRTEEIYLVGEAKQATFVGVGHEARLRRDEGRDRVRPSAPR